MNRSGRRVFLAGLAVPLIATAALGAPLWVYAVSLALFGLPHVLVELRYVDQRFAARLPRWAIVWMGLGLLAVAALRGLSFAGLANGLARPELALGIGLVAIVVPLAAARAAATTSAVAFLAAGVLLTGLLYAPLQTLVILALLHNLTPVGFLAERLRGRTRVLALLGAGAVLFVVPAIMVSLPLLPALVSGPFGTGELALHLHAFVPRVWIDSAFGERLFAAAAYLQVMHYAVVLLVLPRLGDGGEAGRAVLPWPSRRVFASSVLGLSAVAAAGFAFDFGDARSGYGIVAAVHAWIEIPVLIAACAIAPVRSGDPVSHSGIARIGAA